MEHKKTGKSRQKCYSRINDGLDKLTGDKFKDIRARLLLTQCPVLLIHSPTLIDHSIPLKHNYSIGVIQILQSIRDLNCYSTEAVTSWEGRRAHVHTIMLLLALYCFSICQSSVVSCQG